MVAAWPSRANSSLAVLESAYAEHLDVFRPDLASRYGSKRAAALLVAPTRSGLDRDYAWLTHFQSRLEAAPRATLAPAEQARLDTLLARTKRQMEECGPGGALRLDPLAYRALTDQAVLEALTMARVSACERVRRATQRLRMLPEVLRAAAINLQGLPHDDLRVQQGVDEAMRVLRVEVTAAAAACRDPRRSADFVEADSAAIRAFTIFPSWLHGARGHAP